MADIRQCVGVAASSRRVYDALATADGLSEWWTRDARGDAQVGSKPEFYCGYPEPAAVTRVTDLVPLLGLKAGLEDGPATPHPEDMKISGWG